MSGMPIEQQFRLFLYVCAFGLVAGLIFDFFKAWGKVFNFSRRAVFLVDFNFCLLFALTLFCLLLHTNRGEVRFYTFMALAIGILLYYGFGSPYLYQSFLVFFQAVKSLGEKIAKTVCSWQELVIKKRTIYRSYYARWKRFFRKED